MNRKPDGSSQTESKWLNIVISWINLFEKETVSKISNVKNSKFFIETIRAIFEFNGLGDVSFKNSDDLAIKFIKQYFPEIIKEKRFNTKNEDDILILISLLMYTTCIKYKIQDFVVKTCSTNLDDNHQEAMKKFFEVMLTIEEGNFTRRNITDAIPLCFENLAVTGAKKSLSPSTKRNCLKEFLESPALQEKYKKNKEENDVKHLNAFLQEENSELMCEKETLIQKNHELEVSVKKLKTNLNEKTQEIVSLREELLLYENKEIADVSCSKIVKSRNQEIDQIKNDLKYIQLLNENLLLENGNFIKQISNLEVEKKGREDEIIGKGKIIDDLEQQLQDFERNCSILQSQVKELKQIIEQFQEEKSPNMELNISAPREEDIAQIVFDLELKEKEETMNRLRDNLKSLELLCEEKAEHIKQFEISQEKLQNEFQSKSLMCDKANSTISNLNSQLNDKNSELKTLNSQVKTLNNKIDILKDNLTASLADNKDLENHLAYSLNNIALLNTSVEDKDLQIDQLKTLIQTFSEDKNEFELKIEHQARKIEELKMSETNLHQQVAELKTSISALEGQLSIALAKSQEVADKDTQLTELQTVICTLEKDKQDITLQLQEQVSSLKDSVKNSKKLITKKESVLESLQTQLNIKSGEIDQLKEKVKILVIDKEHLNDILKQVESEDSLNQQTKKDLLNEIARLKNYLEENKNKLTSVEQEFNDKYEKVTDNNKHLKKQVEDHYQLKEDYGKLFDDYHRLNGEHDELNSNFEDLRASVRAEYEEILRKIKTHMKTTFTQALEKKEEKHAKVLRDLQNIVKANQEHISQLSTNLWDTSDKLLITRNENEELKKTVANLTRTLSLQQSTPNNMERTRSHEHLGFQNYKPLQMVEEDSVTLSRRQSVRTVPSEIGKVFPSEDEAEEMFNNDNLADLKVGRCVVETSDSDRMSTLMNHNSLCPPHLKSSYPEETPIDILHEDDIKERELDDDVKLLADRSQKSNDRSQHMVLKNLTTPRSALKELNAENRKLKPGTPSRLFTQLFSTRQRRPEVTQSTPDKRRLSCFGRHFNKKEPSE